MRRNKARSVTAQNYLSSLWNKAYTDGKVDISVQTDFEAQVIYKQIDNYRNSVARNKLNPRLCKEWFVINSCRISKPKFGCRMLTIRRKTTLELERKYKLDMSKHPSKHFNIPKGIYDGASRSVNN